ncbi:hypothetical protein F511_18758 [Dorcoceras hygrometricum]|uniref:Uncharacterized protein n=1 Tax=Dorcoceras hygrometricum TaxID=472368 RepID=A0A2Z7D8Y8_9LAMI|nr:hypothetical protein F511_18758 [Dorcoceras hygrometricum]
MDQNRFLQHPTRRRFLCAPLEFRSLHKSELTARGYHGFSAGRGFDPAGNAPGGG